MAFDILTLLSFDLMNNNGKKAGASFTSRLAVLRIHVLVLE